MVNQPQESKTLPTPGPIGRTVRMVAGLLLLLLLAPIWASYSIGQPSRLSSLLLWLGAAYAFYSLPDVGSLPFGREPNRRLQVIVACAVLAAGLADLIRTGDFLGSLQAFVLMALVIYTIGVGGVSYLLAGIFAVPG